MPSTKENKPRIDRSERRKHLEDRLKLLHQREMIIEQSLKELEEDRFYRACIFGSARTKPEDPEYKQAYELARMLAHDGIDVLTGGGPGLMEAANKGHEFGASEAKSKAVSFGLTIQLQWEPESNKHLDIKHHHFKFSSRLDQFMQMSHSIVATPGGIGTVLELFFTWQLIQVKHITPRPIVLLDKKFWQGLYDWMHSQPLSRKLVSDHDFDCIKLVDTPEEAYKIIADHCREFRATRDQLKTKTSNAS